MIQDKNPKAAMAEDSWHATRSLKKSNENGLEYIDQVTERTDFNESIAIAY